MYKYKYKYKYTYRMVQVFSPNITWSEKLSIEDIIRFLLGNTVPLFRLNRAHIVGFIPRFNGSHWGIITIVPLEVFLIAKQGPGYPAAGSRKSEILEDFSFTGEVRLTLVCFAQGKVANICESKGANCKSNEKKQKDWANEPWKHLKDFAWADTELERVGVIDANIFLLNEYIFELNPANFNILNKVFNWILSKKFTIE